MARKKGDFRRRWIQLASALIYNAHLKGFGDGALFKGPAKGLCVPGLNCYSCPGAVGACPLGSLQSALNGLPDKLPLYVLGFLALVGLLLGRLVCGFLCPFGLLQELIYRIPTPKLRKNRVTRALCWLKYAILAVFVFALPVWYLVSTGVAVPAFCKFICPAGTLEGGVVLMAIRAEYRAIAGALFSWKIFVMAAVTAVCLLVYRAFCRFLCPLGAIYSLFSRIAVFGISVDGSRCDHCGACARVCLMDVKRPGDRECIQCGQCRAACHNNAISYGKRGKKHEKSDGLSGACSGACAGGGLREAGRDRSDGGADAGR